MINMIEVACGTTDRVIHVGEAEDLLVRELHLNPSNSSQIVQDIYHRWLDRRNDLTKPLIRRFWPPTPVDDPNPHLVFRPREKERCV